MCLAIRSELSVAPNSGFVSFMSLAVLDNLMGIGAVTLLVYEHIINLDKEIQYVWLRKKTGAAVLYLIIRYMALFTLVILEVISYVVPMSDAVS
ncbi:hypothetical protein GY45DRAFT_679438 [Cubamyces sp. BRFM 1775]|nr:hypothetical protein GY45DRAFT_679438 [Cubamyces sp. BRFM 1775]